MKLALATQEALSPFLAGAAVGALLTLAFAHGESGAVLAAMLLSLPSGVVALGLARLASPGSAELRWDQDAVELREGRRRVAIRWVDARRHAARLGELALVQFSDEQGRTITVAGKARSAAKLGPPPNPAAARARWHGDELSPLLEASATIPVASSLEADPSAARTTAGLFWVGPLLALLGVAAAQRSGPLGVIALSFLSFGALALLISTPLLETLRAWRRARALRADERLDLKPGVTPRLPRGERELGLDLSDPAHDDALLAQRAEALFVRVRPPDERGPYREHERVRPIAIETLSERRGRRWRYAVAGAHVALALGALALVAIPVRAAVHSLATPTPPRSHEQFSLVTPPPPPLPPPPPIHRSPARVAREPEPTPPPPRPAWTTICRGTSCYETPGADALLAGVAPCEPGPDCLTQLPGPGMDQTLLPAGARPGLGVVQVVRRSPSTRVTFDGATIAPEHEFIALAPGRYEFAFRRESEARPFVVVTVIEEGGFTRITER